MSSNMENYLIMFLELQQMKKNKVWQKFAKTTQSKRHGQWLEKQINAKGQPKNVDDGRRRKILKMLWEKFNESRTYPNMKQIIKIDIISDGLKPYLLDEKGYNIKANKKRYAVSFDKIVNIYEN